MQHCMKISYLVDCTSDKSCVNFQDQLELCEKELEDFLRWCNQRAILSKVRWYNKHEKIQSTFLILKRDTINLTIEVNSKSTRTDYSPLMLKS